MNAVISPYFGMYSVLRKEYFGAIFPSSGRSALSGTVLIPYLACPALNASSSVKKVADLRYSPAGVPGLESVHEHRPAFEACALHRCLETALALDLDDVLPVVCIAHSNVRVHAAMRRIGKNRLNLEALNPEIRLVG